MASEIDVMPLDTRSPVTRARHRRSIMAVVVAVTVVALVSGGWVGARSLREMGPRPIDTPPAPTIVNGPIAVSGWVDGVRELTPTGTGRFIFRCARTCSHVSSAWSPDGTRLAFSTSCGTSCVTAGDQYNGIHVVDLDSGTDRLLVPGEQDGDLAWSPDGKRIAYVWDTRLYVMNADGSARTLITHGLPAGLASPSWSPDGTRIAFTDDAGRLLVAGLDGSAPSILGVEARYPAWSPDGTTIAYFSGSYPTLCDIRESAPDGRRDVSLIDLEGVTARCDYGGGLAWSPDGTELAALIFEELEPRDGSSAVYIVTADGSGARPFMGWTAGWSFGGLTWRPLPATAGSGS
jgi:dipeptidyl aminopeptidase/acylaminoacyl peptidase